MISHTELTGVIDDTFQHKSSKELLDKFFSFFNDYKNSVIQDFYVGISDNPENKLFNKHKVRPENARFIILFAQCFEVANEVKKALLKLDINGCTKPDNGNYIYCYFIDGYTSETE